MMLPRLIALPLLRIDGISHHIGDLAVLRRNENLPGGLRWSLDFDERAVAAFLNFDQALRSGHVTQTATERLRMVIQSLVKHGNRRARFLLTTIDRIETLRTSVRIIGTCAPLTSVQLGSGGLTRSCS